MPMFVRNWEGYYRCIVGQFPNTCTIVVLKPSMAHHKLARLVKPVENCQPYSTLEDFSNMSHHQ